MEDIAAVAALAALAQGRRLRIVRSLIGAAPQRMTPGDLTATLDVLKRREGRNLIFRPSIEPMNDLLACLTAQSCQGEACEVVSRPGCTTC